MSIVLSILLTGCALLDRQSDQLFGVDRGSVVIEGVGFMDPLNPLLYTVKVKRSWVGNCNLIRAANCGEINDPLPVDLIQYQHDNAFSHDIYKENKLDRTNFVFDADHSVTGTFTIVYPGHPSDLWVRLQSVHAEASSGARYYYAWSNGIWIPEPRKVPTVRVFAHASPAGEGGTVVDARLSTGVGTLSYTWSPGCAGTTYHEYTLPAGTAAVANGYTGKCGVTVQAAQSAAATAAQSAAETASRSIDVTSQAGLVNGVFLLDGSKAVTINGASDVTSGWAGLACVDVGGTGVYATPVPLGGTNPSTATFSLSDAQVSAGLHQIGATLWAAGANAGCAVTSTVGALQTIMDLYEGSGTGASALRRLARPSAFVAASALRLVPSKTVSAGSIDAKSGLLRRATLSGTFSWSTPKLANGVRRPAGVANLAKGTYVMRSIGMQFGPRAGTATTLLGTGTLLLRGVDGTLACGALTGGFDSSTLRLQGGTLSARRLVGTVAGAPVTYVFPPVPGLGAKRSDGVLGLVESVLALLPGDQPADRAATKPTKPKPTKPKPVKAAGTATLRTAAKATALTAACKALVRYLP